MNPSKIKAIDKTSVHRICSGQVVLSLAVAVKELIENSIDAGATVVNIRLKEYGSELLEVSDNGSGVHPDNFEGLTLKHHTSKLSDFSDLESVATFGFRGEALSSLCALSKVTISTRHSSQDVGTCLVFEHTGVISTKTQISRLVGTTVSLANLFSTLPVRQKEFHRNLKKEFNKMTQLLNAYCLVSTGVKIVCTNQTGKGSKTTFVSTLGCPTVKENISSVFGPKQLNNLLEVKTVRPNSETLEELKIEDDMADMFCLEGYVSSCAHGSGRPTNDRQFYYINSRPCEPSKVAKAVNEVYHQYNLHQSPFVYMNIRVDRTSVDVNVTPDKRQVFLDQEKLLIATIKASLMNLYEKIPSTYNVNNLRRSTNFTSAITLNLDNKPALSKFNQFRHANDLKRELPLTDKYTLQKVKQMKLDLHLTYGKTELAASNLNCKINKMKEQKATESYCYTSETSARVFSEETETVIAALSTKCVENMPQDCKQVSKIVEKSGNILVSSMNPSNSPGCNKNTNIEYISMTSECCKDDKTNHCENFAEEELTEPYNEACADESLKRMSPENCEIPVGVPDSDDTVTTDRDDEIPFRKIVNIELNMDMLKRASSREKNRLSRMENPRIKFRATIDPVKNSEAEQELSREISKDMFSQMDIIGQFNLGFIITKLNSDLFIVDQHATDEKYNFETLQQTTTLSNQKFVVPQNLELTAANECLLLENLDVFHKNGFEFNIDENEVASKRVKLSAVPISKNWVFGKEDIDELLFMLQDVNVGTMCRPSRVRSMFASRACRMSIMIGSHLSSKDMRRLIDHMGQIEQPWNCPHGRPTMRHLINLELTD